MKTERQTRLQIAILSMSLIYGICAPLSSAVQVESVTRDEFEAAMPLSPFIAVASIGNIEDGNVGTFPELNIGSNSNRYESMTDYVWPDFGTPTRMTLRVDINGRVQWSAGVSTPLQKYIGARFDEYWVRLDVAAGNGTSASTIIEVGNISIGGSPVAWTEAASGIGAGGLGNYHAIRIEAPPSQTNFWAPATFTFDLIFRKSATDTLLSPVIRATVIGYNRTFALSPIVSPPTPQRVVLAFGYQVPFEVAPIVLPFTDRTFGILTNPFGTMFAAPASDSYKNTVLQRIRGFFTDAGVTNIIISVGSPRDDAANIYFSPRFDASLLGYTRGGVDSFNREHFGECVVFVDPVFPDSTLDSESAAHELGHLLGLKHIDPNVGGGDGDEIMDSEFSEHPSFVNVVADVDSLTPDTFQTHNGRFHLRRYVDGASIAELANAPEPVMPGTYDVSTIRPRRVRVTIDDPARQLYGTSVYAIDLSSDTARLLASYDEISAGELSQVEYDVPSGEPLTILSGTAPGVTNLAIGCSGATSTTGLLVQTRFPTTVVLYDISAPAISALSTGTVSVVVDSEAPQLAIQRSSGNTGTLAVAFTPRPNRLYRFFDSADLSSWQEASDYLVAANNESIILDVQISPHTRRFYSVREFPSDD